LWAEDLVFWFWVCHDTSLYFVFFFLSSLGFEEWNLLTLLLCLVCSSTQNLDLSHDASSLRHLSGTPGWCPCCAVAAQWLKSSALGTDSQHPVL
jgi:hypothetical protein